MKRSKKGFSLVEVLVVVVVLGVLSAAMMLASRSGTAKAEAVRIVGDLRTAKAAAVMYYAEKGRWPTEVASIEPYLAKTFENDDDRYCFAQDGALFGYVNDALDQKVKDALLQIADKEKNLFRQDGSPLWSALPDGLLRRLASSFLFLLEPLPAEAVVTPFGVFIRIRGETSGDTDDDDNDDDNDDDDDDDDVTGDPWESGKVYVKGDRVVYNGTLYEAWYWTQGTVPGQVGSPWQEITTEWRDFNKYAGGDVVEYEGNLYTAWYDIYPSVGNVTDPPGTVGSPWQEQTDQWRACNIYKGGDVIWYEGKQYRAKWYRGAGSDADPTNSDAWELL